MTRRRFYAPPDNFSSGSEIVTLAADEARHLREVLRLGPGDEIFVFDGAGREFQCLIEASRRDSASVRVIAEAAPAKPESPLDLTLAVALLKGEKFDLAVQKATELGVARILPVITQRADVRLRDDSDSGKRVARWQRIALEAAKQSGRARVPLVAAPLTFSSLVGSSDERSLARLLMFSERGGETLNGIRQKSTTVSSIVALVGSEGGWTDEEIIEGRGAGWEIVTLGGRILRAETATIAVTALLQHLFGDLN